jgi:hypothetical protein
MQSNNEISLIQTVNKWKSGREVLREFFVLHPELGIRYTENVYNNFVRVHGPRLAEMDVMRKAGLRSPALFDITKFDGAAFDILTRKKQIFFKSSMAEASVEVS